MHTLRIFTHDGAEFLASTITPPTQPDLAINDPATGETHHIQQGPQIHPPLRFAYADERFSEDERAAANTWRAAVERVATEEHEAGEKTALEAEKTAIEARLAQINAVAKKS